MEVEGLEKIEIGPDHDHTATIAWPAVGSGSKS
jgi:hypothetical protein